MKEGIYRDKKSLRTVLGKKSEFNELAKDCVAFANAKGGELLIGIEDDKDAPPCNQIIPLDLPDKIIKRINELTYNVSLQATITTATNNGQYITLQILRSASSVASTSKGGYFIRDDDKSRAMMPEELIRILADRTAYCWETKVTLKTPWRNCDPQKLNQFVLDVQESDRVSSFVKEKSPYELLEYYQMTDDNGFLTNLGVLWIGKREQRARLLYSPVIQYIKYDDEGNKINKIVWNDYSLNPKELVEAIWLQIPDWKETNEISEGLWRKSIPAYNEKVVRESICNALVHRPYTTRGDIFIKLYPDCMKIVNPGQFPFGVTVSNILQKTVQRNEHLSKIFYIFHLMETEGSGYDVMYETLLSDGKEIPIPYEGDDYIELTINRKILNKEASRLSEYVKENYKISQNGLIALGIIIQTKTITAVELSKKLQLPSDERLRSYIKTLINEELICSRGRGKGTKYYINPKLISNTKANIHTTLKTIEPYRLKALIQEDLRFHPDSLISEISKRLPDVDFHDLQLCVRKMAKKGEIKFDGGRKFRRYRL